MKKKKQYSFREGSPLTFWEAVRSGKVFKLLIKGEIPERFRSLKKIVEYNRKYFFRKILKTPPLDSNPSSDVSIHSLVCQQDIEMYLLAIKSFLRFHDNIAVYAHSDGSLDSHDISILKKHIQNISVITRENSLWNEFLELIQKDYIDKGIGNIILMKLFFSQFSDKKKIIILDTDIVFLKKPKILIEWIEKELNCSYYNQDKYDTLRDAEERIKEDFKLNELPINFNAGFIALYNDISLAEIKKFLQIQEKYKDTQITKGDQTIYHLMLANRNAKPLNRKKYVIYDGKNYTHKTVMIHFPNQNRFDNNIYLKLARQVCKEIKY